ncbi:uncharacterized protein LOC141611759 [Silene latifolia]|uniref:uncharacterized protein LOC141611759 n=1 Tax=Silene latifolia TaxID=37657 RepID=UPI003D76EC5A
MVAISPCLCALNLISGPKRHQRLSQTTAFRFSNIDDYSAPRNQASPFIFHTRESQREVVASAKSSESEDKVPSWAQPESDEPPPWARDEAKPIDLKDGFELPFFVYLLASAVTAIAAIGSIFEYANQKPVFGVLNTDSIFYAPVLGFFTFTGIPTSAFLWYKSVQAANKEAEEQDRRDGYR